MLHKILILCNQNSLCIVHYYVKGIIVKCWICIVQNTPEAAKVSHFITTKGSRLNEFRLGQVVGDEDILSLLLYMYTCTDHTYRRSTYGVCMYDMIHIQINTLLDVRSYIYLHHMYMPAG